MDDKSHRELHKDIGVRLLVVETIVDQLAAYASASLSDAEFDRLERNWIDAMSVPYRSNDPEIAASAVQLSQDMEAHARQMLGRIRTFRANMRTSTRKSGPPASEK